MTKKIHFIERLTKAVSVVILGPPAAPDTWTTRWLLSKTSEGLIDDIGLFPGSI